MHYLLFTYSLTLHYLYRYICILSVFIYVYRQFSAINNSYILYYPYGLLSEIKSIWLNYSHSIVTLQIN